MWKPILRRIYINIISTRVLRKFSCPNQQSAHNSTLKILFKKYQRSKRINNEENNVIIKRYLIYKNVQEK